MFKVTFFYPYPDEIQRIGRIKLDEHDFWSHEGKERRRAWILQTYLWLRRADYNVAISDRLPKEGVVVLLVEPDMVASFLNQFKPPHRRLFILTIRADIIGFRSSFGDADIVQNGRFADERRTFFVPHWPQPGLIPRDSSRGAQIQNIVFKGGYGSLHKDFRSERWHTYLHRRNLEFEIASAATEGHVPNWHDYQSADLVLAVRPDFNDGGLRYEKPASKLINSWHAEVPALLGPEYAYREMRATDLDYIEVNGVDEAIEAVEFLIAHPRHYLQMIQRGRERAQEVSPERITERWAEVLFDRIPSIADTTSFALTRKLPLSARRVLNRMAMPPSPFESRKWIGHTLRKMTRSR